MSLFPLALFFIGAIVLVAETLAINPVSDHRPPEQLLQASVSSKTLKLLKKLTQNSTFNCTSLQAELNAIQSTTQGTSERMMTSNMNSFVFCKISHYSQLCLGRNPHSITAA